MAKSKVRRKIMSLRFIGGLVVVGALLVGIAMFTGVLDADVDVSVSKSAKQTMKDTVNDTIDEVQKKLK
jgi:hypothetical protein